MRITVLIHLLGLVLLSLGSTIILASLTASASYIAAPVAIRSVKV